MKLFDETQIAALQAPLDAAHVSQRSKSGITLSYIEGWHAIAEANRIFGHDGWTRETVDLTRLHEPEQNQRGNWVVSYSAKVRVCVGDVVREGCGFGSGFAPFVGDAHESAIKEAETDAMKRALMTFGNPFGLALYDKTKKNVQLNGGVKGETNKMPEPQHYELMTTNGELLQYKTPKAFVDALAAEVEKDPDAAEANRATAEWIYRRHKDLQTRLTEIMPAKEPA